ncbi:MAG: tyrosine-type recombinase/integrase [Candidatus Bathyarchaeota archaeon]|nr:tyrosine-type recombinase/integrase [Candidatus Bathyarchaeota archaeon]
MSKESKPYTQDPYFKRWMSGLSERTKLNYTERIQNWITFTGMDLTMQVSKRMRDLTSQDLSERQFFEDKFRAYKEYLEKRGDLKPLSVRTELTAVASFFSRIGLPLALKRGDWESTQQQAVIQRLKITRDDVKAMYAHANLRDRALLLVLAQSGFSEVDVSNLRIEELKGLYENAETEHYFIEKPREKTNEVQATCFSYEAVHDLKAMLQERGNPTEGFLFVSQTKGKGEQLEVRSINEAMKSLAQKTFSEDKAKDFKTKALRSFYNSALLRAGVSPQELKDLMFGHGRKGARGHYDYDEQTIKEAYGRVFEHVSINGLQVRNDLKKVMDGLNSLSSMNEVFRRQLEAKDRELQELRGELKALSSMIRQVACSEQVKIADEVLAQVADRLLADSEFMAKFKENAQKINPNTLKR